VEFDNLGYWDPIDGTRGFVIGLRPLGRLIASAMRTPVFRYHRPTLYPEAFFRVFMANGPEVHGAVGGRTPCNAKPSAWPKPLFTTFPKFGSAMRCGLCKVTTMRG